MKILEWKDEFLLGIPAVDLKHKRNFDCLVAHECRRLSPPGGQISFRVKPLRGSIITRSLAR